MPEDDPTTFRLYAVLSYTGFLTTKDLPFEWQSLVDIYVLAEKLRDAWAKDHVVEAMHSYLTEQLPQIHAEPVGGSRISECISTASLVELYEGTPTGSQARRLVVDLLAKKGTEDWLKSTDDLLPYEFLFEVTACLLQKRPCFVFGSELDYPSSHYYEKPGEPTGPVSKEKVTARPGSASHLPAAADKSQDVKSTTSEISAPSLFGGNNAVPVSCGVGKRKQPADFPLFS